MEHTIKQDAHATTARDFFLYVAFLITLIWLLVGMLTFIFQIIDILVPDALGYSGMYAGGILTSSMASLIIITPFFLIIGSQINKDIKKTPSKQSMWVRKWLLYGLLLLAFLVSLGDLVVIVNSFLGGELVGRLLWKTLAVLLVSGSVFAYFLFELRRNVEKITKLPLISSIVLGVLAFILIILGFVLGGTPATQRELRFDIERVSDLQNITYAIEQYASDDHGLPETLEALRAPYMYGADLEDPVTNEMYEYSIVSPTSYELCATFARETDNRYSGYADSSWDHGAGRQCFVRALFSEGRIKK